MKSSKRTHYGELKRKPRHDGDHTTKTVPHYLVRCEQCGAMVRNERMAIGSHTRACTRRAMRALYEQQRRAQQQRMEA